jgi:hypothetical protein
MRLTRDVLVRRLRDVDFRIVNEMQCETMQATAHRSRADAERGAHPVTEQSKAGDCWFYRVTYPIKTLLGAGRYSDPRTQPVVVVVDLNQGGNYPFSPPASHVNGSVIPWSPHFYPNPGPPVCFEAPGRVWPKDGSRTLGHLLLHIARLINFDETIDDATYIGYNGEAVKYWRTVLKSGPITPKLAYPMVPSWFFGQLPEPPRKASVVTPKPRPELSVRTRPDRTRRLDGT